MFFRSRSSYCRYSHSIGSPFHSTRQYIQCKCGRLTFTGFNNHVAIVFQQQFVCRIHRIPRTIQLVISIQYPGIQFESNGNLLFCRFTQFKKQMSRSFLSPLSAMGVNIFAPAADFTSPKIAPGFSVVCFLPLPASEQPEFNIIETALKHLPI
ncbi:unknown [Bacteroides stercoris CAG:120]|nr:unknown [Bacteroides stercoris CAG:120]